MRGLLASLSEQGWVTIIVALLALSGVLVTAASALAAALFTRSTNREVKYRNGGGIEGTLAERLDARFERIETRFDRIEDKQQHLDEKLGVLNDRVDANQGRIDRTERNVRDMRTRALAFFDRFYLKERDEEFHRVEDRRQRQIEDRDRRDREA